MTSNYRPWDRDEKLGPVPEGGFKPDDPKVIAWKAAHGHDLRLKCYPEFGCQLLPTEDDYNRLRDAALAVCAAFTHDYPGTPAQLGAAIVRLREVLDDA